MMLAVAIILGWWVLGITLVTFICPFWMPWDLFLGAWIWPFIVWAAFKDNW